MYNVDGGYLTFKMAFGSWDTWEYSNASDVALLAWDNYTKRKDIFPEYKLHRKSKDPLIEDVHKLREQVYEDTHLPLCEIVGCEADDIVACWNLFNPEDKILGIDKDYFQLPEVFSLYHHDFAQYPITNVKVPKYLEEVADKDFALYQMLVGDRADGIPRILEKGKLGKEQVAQILKAYEKNDLADELYKLFGEKIILNAKLILFPFYQYGTHKDWFSAWARGLYYFPEFWEDMYSLVRENRRDVKEIQLSFFEGIF